MPYNKATIIALDPDYSDKQIHFILQFEGDNQEPVRQVDYYEDPSITDADVQAFASAKMSDLNNREKLKSSILLKVGAVFTALLLCLCPRADAAITLVQSRTTNGSGTSLSLAFASPTTAGNVLVAISFTGSAVTQPTSIADTNVTYTARSSATNASSAQAIRIANTDNCAGGADTVTVTYAGSQTIGLVIAEFSGMATSSSFDVQNTGSASGTAMTTGNLVTTQANEVLVYAGSHRNTPATITVGTNFTEFLGANFSNNRISEASYRIVSATGTYTGTATASVGDDWAAACASFKDVGGSGGTTTKRLTTLGVGDR